MIRRGEKGADSEFDTGESVKNYDKVQALQQVEE